MHRIHHIQEQFGILIKILRQCASKGNRSPFFPHMFLNLSWKNSERLFVCEQTCDHFSCVDTSCVRSHNISSFGFFLERKGFCTTTIENSYNLFLYHFSVLSLRFILIVELNRETITFKGSKQLLVTCFL